MLYLTKIFTYEEYILSNIVKIFVSTFRRNSSQMNEAGRIKMCDNCLSWT